MPGDGDPSEQTDEARLSALFEAHYRQVLRFTERRAGDAETAKDVAAETFVVAWRRLDKVPNAAEESLPWLYGVARNILAYRTDALEANGRVVATERSYR